MNVSGLGGIGGLVSPTWPETPSPAGSSHSVPFAQFVRDLLQQVSQTHAQANQAVQAFALGQTDNWHDVLLSLAQADLAFRFLLEVRNRLTEAYQEIIRMPV